MLDIYMDIYLGCTSQYINWDLLLTLVLLDIFSSQLRGAGQNDPILKGKFFEFVLSIETLSPID